MAPGISPPAGEKAPKRGRSALYKKLEITGGTAMPAIRSLLVLALGALFALVSAHPRSFIPRGVGILSLIHI